MVNSGFYTAFVKSYRVQYTAVNRSVTSQIGADYLRISLVFGDARFSGDKAQFRFASEMVIECGLHVHDDELERRTRIYPEMRDGIARPRVMVPRERYHALHHLLQTERPIGVQLGWVGEGTDIKLTSFMLYTGTEAVGEEES